jgi:membrane-bound lytic murein transglycosylase A
MTTTDRPERRWRSLAILLGLATALFAAIALWALLELRRSPSAVEVEGARPEPVPLEDQLVLVRDRFDRLPGWSADRISEALPAWRKSCGRGPSGRSAALEVSGDAYAWNALCSRLATVADGDEAGLRRLVESELEPFAVANRREIEGLLTGYYEPELDGSRRRRGRFRHPLYLAPRDQIELDLGEFRRSLEGRKITGLIRRGRFRPYWDRSEIESGALRRKSLEFLWVDDPVALFFLHIQGSGRVVLPDGGVVRVGYAGQNGHDYTAIGRTLVEMGELELESVSLQSIRAWLRAHPDRAAEVMNANRSYVFFRVLPGKAPVGASGLELTPGRSLAVDDDFLPYNVPLWIASSFPEAPELDRQETPLRRLVLAQDTGGAIRGPVRGDLFLGPGQEAEELAGRMKQPLRAWVLLPRGTAAGPR